MSPPSSRSRRRMKGAGGSSTGASATAVSVYGSLHVSGPAIEALGRLFKITEVLLWDDAAVDFVETTALPDGPARGATNTRATSIDTSVKSSIDGDSAYTEDVELVHQLNALGLPISFGTGKEKRNQVAGGKKKGGRIKPVFVDRDDQNRMCLEQNNCDSHSNVEMINSESLLFNELGNEGTNGDIYSLSSCINIDDEFKSENNDLRRSTWALETPRRCFDAEGIFCDDTGKSNFIHHDVKVSNINDGIVLSGHFSKSCHRDCEGGDNFCNTEETCFSSALSAVSCAVFDEKAGDIADNILCFEYDDWKVAWDASYMRYYFYNCQTHESTWHPPVGIDHFAHFHVDSGTTDKVVVPTVTGTGLENDSSAIKKLDVNGLNHAADSFQVERNQCSFHSVKEVSSRVNLTEDLMHETGDLVEKCAHRITDKHNNIEPLTLHFSSSMDSTTDDCKIIPRDSAVTNGLLKVAVEMRSVNSLHEIGSGNSSSDGSTEQFGTSMTDEVDCHHSKITRKQRRISKGSRSYDNISIATEKYWYQRYSLFSKFDNDIKMDEEGWFSVTPESIARHHASRCGSDIVIDCFCGVGGNSIQFAMKSNHVVAIDIDQHKISYARHNAAIYEVEQRIDFVIADFFKIAPQLKGDVLFLSPPWGGPDYSKVETYDIGTMLQPLDGYSLFKIARLVAPKIVMFLPRNVDLNQLAELSLSTDPPYALEVEKNILNGKLKAVTAYFDATGIAQDCDLS